MKIHEENVDKAPNGQYMITVYMLVNPEDDNKSYIGITFAADRRWYEFLYASSYGGAKIDAARKRFDKNAFRHIILDTFQGDDLDLLLESATISERDNIRAYNSIDHGYNSNEGGPGRRAVRNQIIHSDGTIQTFESYSDTARELGIHEGSVRYYCQTSRKDKHGNRFRIAS